jgi:hypothetical protein
VKTVTAVNSSLVSISSDSALVSITSLGLYVGTGETWRFEWYLSAGSADASGCSCGVNISSATATVEGQVSAVGTGGPGEPGATYVFDRIVARNTPYGGGALIAGVSNGWVKITGVVKSGGASFWVYPAFLTGSYGTIYVYPYSSLFAAQVS